MPWPKDRLGGVSTTTGTGTMTHTGTLTAHNAPTAADDAELFTILIQAVDGNGNPTGDWEVCESVYTHAGTTWSRGELLDSSTGARVSFAAGTKAIVVTRSATEHEFGDALNTLMIG